MSGLLEALQGQLTSNDMLSQLSSQIGADTETTQRAVGAALPVLLGGLARNASTPEGADSLNRALERDHDGSLLSNLGGLFSAAQAFAGGVGSRETRGLGGLMDSVGSMLGGTRGEAPAAPINTRAANGAGILGHILGQRRGAVEQGVSKASGLDAQAVAKLLPLLAPVVMGMLGKARREKNLDAGSLGSMLGQERESVQKKDPEAGGLFGLLDSDDDGQIMDDLARLAGKGLLGKILGR